MLRQLSRPLNSSEIINKPKTPLTKSFTKQSSSLKKQHPLKPHSPSSTNYKHKQNQFPLQLTNYPLTSTSTWLTNTLTKTFSTPHILNFCDTLNETFVRKQHKNFLIDNIKTINKRLHHCNSMINKHIECNRKTAEENLQLEFQQDNIIHERIHMNSQIPRLRIQINDIRDEILKLEKETKQFEIMKYQFIQDKMYKEDELKTIYKKVHELSKETNMLKYNIKCYKRTINEIKATNDKHKKEDSFMKDISKLMKM